MTAPADPAAALSGALLRFAAGLFGVALAIALYPLWLFPAPPWQAPGVATAQNLDVHGPFLFVASLLLLPILVPFLLRPALDRLSGGEAKPWARNAALAALLTGLWAAIARLPLPWVVAPSLLALLACTLWRRFPARFSRRDWILGPAILTVFIALLDLRVTLGPALLVAALLVFALRLLVARSGGRSPARGLSPAACFALAPLGLFLQSHFLPVALRYSPWPALFLALATPVGLRWGGTGSAWNQTRRRRLRWTLAWVIFPLAASGYLGAYSTLSVEGEPRISLFEEAEHVASGHEMMHGEKPYRDIVPAHGFVQDGFFDYVLMRGGAPSLGALMTVRAKVEAAGAALQYALAAAATGSPEVGLAAVILGNFLGTSGTLIRVLPSLASLAFLVWGLRRRNARGFALAAGCAVLAGLTSLDYGTYALGTLAFALLRVRRRAYRRAALFGLAAVAVPVGLAFAAYGILLAFLRATFQEIPSWTAAYTGVPFEAPAGFATWRFFPEVLLALFDHSTFLYVFWLLLIAGVGAACLRPSVRRWEPTLAIGVWCVLNGLAYAGRHHTTFLFAVAPFLAVLIWRAARAPTLLSRCAAALLVLAVPLVGSPLSHLAVIALQREAGRSFGGHLVTAGWTEIAEVPRAQGALWEPKDAARVRAVRRYVDAHLAPGETFFDFANSGLLYYLLDRDCPVRWIEVAFYESPAAQQQVIARLIADPSIRFALLAAPDDACNGVDCISNRVRAPRVWEHIERNFVLDHRDEGLEFWRRR